MLRAFPARGCREEKFFRELSLHEGLRRRVWPARAAVLPIFCKQNPTRFWVRTKSRSRMRQADRTIGEGQLLAIPPVRAYVIDFHQPPHAFDRARFEPVPSVGAGGENNGAVEFRRRAPDPAPFRIINVGAPILRIRPGAEI